MEEPCLPIKLAHGHVLNLLEKKPDYIFMPVQCTMEKLSGDFKKSWNCPLTQSLPFLILSSTHIKEALEDKDAPILIQPIFHPDRGRKGLRKKLRKTARLFGIKSTCFSRKSHRYWS